MIYLPETFHDSPVLSPDFSKKLYSCRLQILTVFLVTDKDKLQIGTRSPQGASLVSLLGYNHVCFDKWILLRGNYLTCYHLHVAEKQPQLQHCIRHLFIQPWKTPINVTEQTEWVIIEDSGSRSNYKPKTFSFNHSVCIRPASSLLCLLEVKGVDSLLVCNQVFPLADLGHRT